MDAEADVNAETNTDAMPNADTEANTNAEANTDTVPNADAATYEDAEANGYSKPNGYPKTNTNANAGSDAISWGYTNAGSHTCTGGNTWAGYLAGVYGKTYPNPGSGYGVNGCAIWRYADCSGRQPEEQQRWKGESGAGFRQHGITFADSCRRGAGKQ